MSLYEAPSYIIALGSVFLANALPQDSSRILLKEILSVSSIKWCKGDSMTAQFSRTPILSLTMKSMWHFVLETGIQDKALSWESLTFGIQMRNSVDSLVNNHITIDPVEAKNIFCEIKKRRKSIFEGIMILRGQTLPLPLQSSLLKSSSCTKIKTLSKPERGLKKVLPHEAVFLKLTFFRNIGRMPMVTVSPTWLAAKYSNVYLSLVGDCWVLSAVWGGVASPVWGVVIH